MPGVFDAALHVVAPLVLEGGGIGIDGGAAGHVLDHHLLFIRVAVLGQRQEARQAVACESGNCFRKSFSQMGETWGGRPVMGLM